MKGRTVHISIGEPTTPHQLTLEAIVRGISQSGLGCYGHNLRTEVDRTKA